MTVTQEQFYLEHKDADGNLSAEHAAQILTLPVEGDTEAPKVPESSDKPEVATEPKEPVEGAADKGAEPKQADEPKETPKSEETTTPVVLAKDGVHTIPYEKLAEAREQAKTAEHWKQVAAAQAAEIEALKKAPPQQPETPKPEPAAPAAGTLDLGDFSEEAIAKGLEKALNERVASAVESATKGLTEKLGKAEAAAQSANLEKHYTEIYRAHPDADSIAESAELKAWIESHPKFAQQSFWDALQSGTTAEVVGLFTAFKEATAKPAASAEPASEPKKPDAAAKAAEVIANAKAPTPSSLSDLPAGSSAHHDEAAALLEMSPEALLTKLEKMPASKVEELMSRVL